MRLGRFDLKISHKVMILVTAPILFMLVFIGVLSNLQMKAEQAVWRERHYKDITNECNSILMTMLHAGMVLHVYQTTHQESALKRFDEEAQSINEHIRTLKEMSTDSPRQTELLLALEAAADKGLSALQGARESAHGGRLSSVSELVNSGAEAFIQFRDLIQKQEELAASGQSEEEARQLISDWLMGGIVLSVLLAVVSAAVFNRSTTRRLLLLTDNTHRLAAKEALLPAVGGKDEIAQLERVFHDMANSLTEAAKHKQEILSVVSHDLRTPLTSIRGCLTLLSAGALGNLSDSGHENVGIAERNVQRLIALINDLLDLEKLEAGKLELVTREWAVMEILDRSSEMVLGLGQERQVEVELIETPLTITADGDRLSQVLVNLLSNAIKFSPANSKVIVSAAYKDNAIEFTVKDHGRGIPAEFTSTIFGRYNQVEPNDGQRGRGTGLGLPICQAYVEAHGGTIGVHSVVGEGSTFWFKIPTANLVDSRVHAP